MPEICCVLNCPHVSGQCQFRSFPKDPEKTIMWKRSIRQNNMVIKKQTRICDCHFDSGMFWQNKEGKKYLKANSLPSITVPKLKDTQVQKIIKVSPDKNINKEETTFQLQFVQGTMNTQGKRRYSGCYEDYDPGPKRQKTDGQFETESVPSVQKEVAKVVKRNQVERESPSPAHKQAVRAPKRSQVESEGILPNQKGVARARKGSQTENGAPSAHEVGKVTKRSQIESGSTPPAQKIAARAPKRSQVKNQSAPSAPNEVLKAPKRSQIENGGPPPAQKEGTSVSKNVQREVPSLEKTKVAKPPNKDPQAAVTGTKTIPEKKWCKLDDICRLCIKKCDRPTNVYDSDLVFKIQAISSIKEMCLTDGLPPNVCQDCKDMTNIFFSFKLQCEAADETLRSCLKALQVEESNDTVVKQQTVAKPLFPELFKFSAFSSDDESDNEEVDSELLEEEEEEAAATVKAVPMVHTVPAAKVVPTVKAVPVVQAAPAVKAAPAIKATPVAKTVPAVKAAPAVKTTPVAKTVPAAKAAPAVKATPVVKAVPVAQAAPAVKATPLAKTVPAVKAAPSVKATPIAKAVPAVRKVSMIHKVPVVQTPIPSTSTRRTKEGSPPSTSLQDELDKAWTEFSHEKGSLVVMRKSTTITRQENKPQYAESKDVAPKSKSVTKIISSPKPTIFISPTMQKEFGIRKDEPQKQSTPQPVCKPQLLERQNKSLHTKADLMKYLGNNVEVIQQKSVKGPAGKVLVKMVNNPKGAFNTKVDQHEIDGMKLQQKISDVNVENKADKQNGSGENITTVLGSDSLFKVKRLNSEGSEMKKLGPAMSAFKVGALGQNVEIYRIPGQKPKPLISNPVVVENKSPTTSKTKDLTLQRTQIQEKTTKIQESNGHIVQASKTENSPLCHIEIFKVQNHSDKKLCLTALEGTEVSLHSVAQVPSTKLVSLANKLEQNLQPVVTSSTKNVSDSAAKLEQNLEHTSDDKEEDTPNAELDQRLEGDAKMHESSTSDEGNSEQNPVVESADDDDDDDDDDDAPATSSLEPSDLRDADESATHSEPTKSDAEVVQEENDVNIPATEKLEENLEAEVLSNAKIGDDSTATTAELEQTSQPDDAKNSNAVSPTSEKLVKTFPRPCKSISLPSPALTTAIPKKAEETVENLELKEHEDATQNKIEDESEKNMEVQEQEECVDMAKTVETENVSDITQNIVEELLNGAAMFVDAESVGGPEVPLALGEPERKTNEAEPLNDIFGSTHETELSQDISKLIEQTEEAVDVHKVEDKKEADKPDDTTNEKQSETEEMETVEEVSKLEKISEECSQDTSGGGAVVPTDCDEKPADRKRGSDRTDDERQCHICAKSFPASALQRHIASHWCEKDLLCEKCGISFFFPADLERHVISHGPQELAANKEDSSPVKQQQQEQQHKRQPPSPKATRQRTFTCGACGLDFTNWFQLRDHKLIHKKGKRHRCGSCSKHFRTKYLLQNHMWVHTMLKKPNCELCGKTFSLPWYVDRHIAEEHS